MICRLCRTDCENGSKKLYDSVGQHNEVYSIVIKYFSEYLDMDAAKACNDSVICEICWNKIYEFYEYQQMVIAAQEQYEVLLKYNDFKKEANLNQGSDKSDALTVVEPNTNDVELHTNFSIIFDEGNVKEESLDYPEILDNDPVAIEYDSKGEMETAEAEIDSDDKPLITRISQRKKRRKMLQQQNYTQNEVSLHIENKPSADTQSNKEKATKSNIIRSKNLEADEFIAINKPILQCSICEESSKNFNELRHHFRIKHDPHKPFVVCCQKKYYDRFHLVEHLHLHLNSEHFKCKECGKCSANSSSLATHMKVVHGQNGGVERRFECEVCHKKFATKAILHSHTFVHAEGSKDHKCPHCSKAFVIKKRLDIHIRAVHESACVCEWCGKSLQNQYILKRHLLMHTDTNQLKVICDLCGVELNSKFSLKRHKRTVHNDGTTVYVCRICGKESTSKDALRSHKRYVHERERTHQCSVCNKAFKIATMLKEHMSTHTGEDLYNCPHCTRTFKSRANMHHHRKRMHPKEWADNLRIQSVHNKKIDIDIIEKVVY